MKEEYHKILAQYQKELNDPIPIYPSIMTQTHYQYLFAKTYLRLQDISGTWYKVYFSMSVRVSHGDPVGEDTLVSPGFYDKLFGKVVNRVELLKILWDTREYVEALKKQQPDRLIETANQASEEKRLALINYGPNLVFPEDSFKSDFYDREKGEPFARYLNGEFN